MFKVQAIADVDNLIRRLDHDQKQIAFATARALTKTAEHVKAEEYKEMRRVFDRPTNYTLNSLFIKPATKARLEAKVWVKDDVFKGTPAVKYILPHVDASPRRVKRFERALMSAGMMPNGYYAVPGAAAPLDAYGNIPSKFIVQLLSYLQAFGEQGYRANATDMGRQRFNKAQGKRVGGAAVSYFVINKQGHLPLGIYMRVKSSFGGAIKPVIIFVKNAHYKAIYNFTAVAERTIRQVFPLYLSESIDIAISTQR